MEILGALFAFTSLVVLHEFGHFWVARYHGVRIEIFSIGFGPILWKKKFGDTDFCISLFPLGGYVKMAGDDFSNPDSKSLSDGFLALPPHKRNAIALGGPIMNYIVAIVLFIIAWSIGVPRPTTQIGEILPQGVAATAGIQKEDTITSLNGTPVKLWSELVKEIQAMGQEGQDFDLELTRNGQTQTVHIPYQGQFSQSHKLGIMASSETTLEKYPLKEAISRGFKKPFTVSLQTLQALGDIFKGKMKAKDGLTGPIGIFKIATQTSKNGFLALLYFMAILSVALGLFNLFPLPGLDGGHIFLYTIEQCIRKSLPQWVYIRFQQFGMTLLIGLSIFVLYNDIHRIISK